MTRYISVSMVAAAFCLLAVAPQEAAAQRGGIYAGTGVNPYNPRPTVSPYLNLLQNGGNALALPQYQTLVRPFLEQQAVNERNSFESQSLRRQVNSLQGQVSRQGDSSAIRATGHPTRYMNYSHYFPMGR